MVRTKLKRDSEYSSIMSSLDAGGRRLNVTGQLSTPVAISTGVINSSSGRGTTSFGSSSASSGTPTAVVNYKGTYRVDTAFSIDPVAQYSGAPLKAGQKTSFNVGDIITVVGGRHFGIKNGGTTVLDIPLKYQDGTIKLVEEDVGNFTKVSTTCGQNADGADDTDTTDTTDDITDMGNDDGECVNPDATVFDNDPEGEASIPDPNAFVDDIEEDVQGVENFFKRIFFDGKRFDNETALHYFCG